MNENDFLKQSTIIAKQLSQISLALKKASAKLSSLPKTQPNDLTTISEILDALNLDFQSLIPTSALLEIKENLKARHQELKNNAHHNFIKSLKEKLDPNQNLKFISDNPLSIYLHPLTLIVHFDKQKTLLQYANETITESSLNPDQLIQDFNKTLDNFRQIRLDSKSFLKILYKAYKMLLLKQELPPNQPINIVDLIQPLSWLHPCSEQHTKKANTLMPKYLLAYQLQKLRNDRQLEIDNKRLNLGTATGASTKNKNNVIFIPFTDTEGQYYLSLAFTPL